VTTHEKSSGNVFPDLGVPNSEQELFKAKLTIQIYKLIKEQNLTQAKAAELLGTTQAQVSVRAFDWFRDRRTLRARIGGRLALGARLCARTQCISRSAVDESLWPALGRLVGHRADRTFDRRRVRELWVLAQRVCYGRGARVPARCWRPFYPSARQAERPSRQPDFSGGPNCLDLWRDRALVRGERCDRPLDQGPAHRGNRCGVLPDDADRSARRCSAPAKRRFLATVRDWRGALDDIARSCQPDTARWRSMRRSFCSACMG
jgi:predicted XRE-type DNA-binding protein